MTSALVKHWRLASLVLGIIVFLWVLYLLRTVILPFAAGLVLAYLFMPVISWLENNLPPRSKWPSFKRVFSILIVFLLIIILIGVFSYFIVTAIVDASIILLESAPDIISRSLYQIQQWLEGVRQQFPPEVSQQVDAALLQGGENLGNSIRDAMIGGISWVPRNISTILGFAALPFFLFYLLKDSEKLKRGFIMAFTPGWAEHTRNVMSIIERVLGRYIRAQLMLGLIVAYFAFIGLLVLGIQFAPVLAILAGVTELIPTLGPWIGGGVALIVTLAVAPEKALWVALLYLGIQVVENYFLVPRIQSAYLRIHPAVMIFMLVLGAYLAGFWGLLLAAPLTATFVEIYRYIRGCYAETGHQPAVQG
ncbi:AI-2E family transporter [Chloroflexota bacterium]